MDKQKAQIPPIFWEAETDLPVCSYFITGEVGTGKSYTASALAIKAIEESIGYVSFRSVKSLFDHIREYDPFNPNDYSRAIIENASLLVIDDAGKESMTDWKFEQLFGLINHRYEHGLTTIITSNYSLSELAQKWGNDANGQAIVSRIYEMCEVIVKTGDDKRLS